MTRLCLVVVFLGTLTGCANQSFTQSGFLDSYEHEPVEGFKDMVASVDRESLGSYRRVYIAEPEWRVDESVEVDAEAVSALSDYLVDAFRRELSQCLTVTDNLEPGVLTLRSALTDVDSVSRAMNVFTSVVFFGPVDNGGATVEFVLEDADQSVIVASGVGFEAGGLKEVTKSFSKYGHTEFALDEIAKGVKASLEGPQNLEPAGTGDR